MAAINVTSVVVHDNPAKFNTPLKFEITFECNMELKDDLEWSVTYVGSASSTEYDQVLDTILLGPVAIGVNRFIFQTDPPDIYKIPRDEWIGVTVLLLTCKYRDQEFIRVGYYVRNHYPDLEETPENLDEGEEICEEDEDDEDEEDEEYESMEIESEEKNMEIKEEKKQPKKIVNIDPDLIIRNIIEDNPRVTHFKINWYDR